MESDEIRYWLGKCIHLKYYFFGFFAAENFPKLTRKGLIIVNASPSQHSKDSKEFQGKHWMVLLCHENKVYLADSLGIPTQNYIAT